VSGVATTNEERPVFFDAAGEDIFGVITEPAGKPKGAAVILLAGGGYVQAVNRNRLSVRIARRVAALGYHSLRLDYHGFGESTGDVEGRIRLDRPFVDDLLGAVRCLEKHGVGETVLAGWCFGARTALASVDRIPSLRGVALLATPIRDFEIGEGAIELTPTSQYLRRAFSTHAVRELLDARRRQRYLRIARTKVRAAVRSGRRVLARGARGAADGISPLFSDPLAKLAADGTPVLLAYGEEDNVYGPFREARPELDALLDVPGARIEERVIAGGIHSLSRLAVQDAVASLLVEWLERLDAGAARGA
jgi:pimeloyl-ACP methyl ester carboxylesterase